MADNSDILNKLDIIIKLLAQNTIKDMTQKDSILYLSQLDFDNSTIANITGASANTVSVRKAEAKKQAGKKNGK